MDVCTAESIKKKKKTHEFGKLHFSSVKDRLGVAQQSVEKNKMVV